MRMTIEQSTAAKSILKKHDLSMPQLDVLRSAIRTEARFDGDKVARLKRDGRIQTHGVMAKTVALLRARDLVVDEFEFSSAVISSATAEAKTRVEIAANLLAASLGSWEKALNELEQARDLSKKATRRVARITESARKIVAEYLAATGEEE